MFSNKLTHNNDDDDEDDEDDEEETIQQETRLHLFNANVTETKLFTNEDLFTQYTHTYINWLTYSIRADTLNERSFCMLTIACGCVGVRVRSRINDIILI